MPTVTVLFIWALGALGLWLAVSRGRFQCASLPHLGLFLLGNIFDDLGFRKNWKYKARGEKNGLLNVAVFI
jgi:hypothetical protein